MGSAFLARTGAIIIAKSGIYLFIVGFQVLVVGLVADVISFNRRLIEETLLRVRRIELTHLNPIKKK
jgi:hypothetical protein